MASRKKTTGDPFIQGFATAIAALADDHREPGVAADICKNHGLMYSDFVAAKVDAYDLRALRESMKLERGWESLAPPAKKKASRP